MRVVPIAAESLGTRSMATFVETRDVRILIDPGVALGPSRYRLPPHRLELERLADHWDAIKAHAEKAEVLCVTHYHYDHHSPEEPEVYGDKEVLLKHPTGKINLSQKKRARDFLKVLEGIPASLEYADGREFAFGETMVRFSPPVCHGADSRLGYVTEVSIRDGESCLVHTSDVEGPVTRDQTWFILDESPDVLYLDGPMTYMLGYRFSHESLQEAMKNLTQIMEKTRVRTIITDHHHLRDLKWKERVAPVFKEAEKRGVRVCTAAEFLGRENDLLEARRRELYASDDALGAGDP
jgi:predicted metallo-beta-lactamase superfamily hydrolase